MKSHNETYHLGIAEWHEDPDSDITIQFGALQLVNECSGDVERYSYFGVDGWLLIE
jgi:hypothetical protein